MKQLVRAYLWFEKFVPGLFFVSIFAVMLLEIISRGVFEKSFAWSTEYCRYALVWAWYADSGWRLRFSYSVQRFANLSIAYSEEGLHFNGLVLVFDRDDRLVEKRTGHLDRLEAEIRRPSQLTPVDDTGT